MLPRISAVVQVHHIFAILDAKTLVIVYSCINLEEYRIDVPTMPLTISSVKPFFYKSKLVSLLVSTDVKVNAYEVTLELRTALSKLFNKINFSGFGGTRSRC